MKFISYKRDDSIGFARLEGDRVLDLSHLGKSVSEVIAAFMASENSGADLAGVDVCSLSEVELLPPVPQPNKMFITGWNYQDHAAETKTDVPPEPVVLARYPDSVVGHDQPVVRTLSSDTYDFEGELAVVIGKGGRRIPRELAMDHVFGFSCFMEGSVRQYQGYSPTAGKNFYQSGAFGPWIISRQGIDEKSLELTTYLNGEPVQETTTGLMVYDIPHLISHISEFTPLSPGDVIATGTPAGVGARRDPKLWLKPGDLIEVEISQIGRLSNRVVDEAVVMIEGERASA